jgi:hypothetical protein
MLLNIAHPLQTGAFLWRRSFVQQYRGWDVTLPIGQDTDFAIRMMSFKPKFAIVADGSKHAVWRSVGGDSRITTKMSEEKLNALLDIFERHMGMLLQYGSWEINHALARRFYGVARLAYAFGDPKIGEIAEVGAKSLGLSRPPEGKANAALTRVLGLRRKTQLIGKIHQIRHKRDLTRRPYPYNVRRV